MKNYWHLMRLLPAMLVMTAIFILSHQHGSSLHLPTIPYIDKAGHFVLYFFLAGTVIFAVPAAIALRRGHFPKTAVYVLLFCLVYGLSDELHQIFIPGREASVADLAADLLGAASLIFLWYRKRCSQQFQVAGTQMDDPTSPYRC